MQTLYEHFSQMPFVARRAVAREESLIPSGRFQNHVQCTEILSEPRNQRKKISFPLEKRRRLSKSIYMWYWNDRQKTSLSGNVGLANTARSPGCWAELISTDA